MVHAAQVSLSLRGQNRRADRAWVEERDALPPPWEEETALLLCRAFAVTYRPKRRRQPCLVWEPGEGTVTLKENFWERVADLAREVVTQEISWEDQLCRFWEEWGPLWPLEECALPLRSIERSLGYIALLGEFLAATRPAGKGMPPPLGRAERWLADLLGSQTDVKALLAHLGIDEGPDTAYTPEYVPGVGYLPVAGSAWMRVPIPAEEAPAADFAFPDREKGLRWVWEHVLLPSAAHLLRGSVQFVPNLNERGGVILEASCTSAYALVVAQMVLGNTEWKLCRCGCGALVPPGQHYATKRCRWKAREQRPDQQPYRRVCRQLNTWVTRGKLTEQERLKGRQIALELRPQYDHHRGLLCAVLERLGRVDLAETSRKRV